MSVQTGRAPRSDSSYRSSLFALWQVHFRPAENFRQYPELDEATGHNIISAAGRFERTQISQTRHTLKQQSALSSKVAQEAVNRAVKDGPACRG